MHQTKRRFTDFVFQRVTLRSSDGAVELDSATPPLPAAQRILRSPRSVSSLHIPNRRSAQKASSSGVPQVRATSPGAEFREAQRHAAAQKEAEEKRKRALYSHTAPVSAQAVSLGTGVVPVTASRVDGSAQTASPARPYSMRRFQITRPNSATLGSSRTPSGIQKRRADGSVNGVAVLVEQLRHKPHSRQASMVADIVDQAQLNDKGVTPNPIASNLTEFPSNKPRKRPVVNQAEKRWRAERQAAISAAKTNISDTLERSAQTNQRTWDEESERLAKEFEQVALEIEQDMDVDSLDSEPSLAPTPQRQIMAPPPALKYQPRPPKQPRSVQSQKLPVGPLASETAMPSDQPMEENDDDYVYDVYIRRPLMEDDMLMNPLTEMESEEQLKALGASRHGVGVIVITAEDEEYWEHFVEDDEEEWDSEDEDSNGESFHDSSCFAFQNGFSDNLLYHIAENNPANEYPDEELSDSDEEDDPTAIYRKYRVHAVSDDEEFDFDDSDSGGSGFGSSFRYGRHHGRQGDLDTDSD